MANTKTKLITFFVAEDGVRRWIQSPKTRPGADCSSDYQLLIAKFRLKLKKVWKTTRPFRYEAALITQLLKNLPGMQETPVQFLGW